MDLIVRNARLADREEPVDLAVDAGTFTEIGPQLKIAARRKWTPAVTWSARRL